MSDVIKFPSKPTQIESLPDRLRGMSNSVGLESPNILDEAAEQLEALATALGEALFDDRWQVISTAPDGWLWLYVPSKMVPQKKGGPRRVHGRQISGRWIENPGIGKGYELSDHAKELVTKHGGFWSSDKQGRRPITGIPTHWQHLSEPPA